MSEDTADFIKRFSNKHNHENKLFRSITLDFDPASLPLLVLDLDDTLVHCKDQGMLRMSKTKFDAFLKERRLQ